MPNLQDAKDTPYEHSFTSQYLLSPLSPAEEHVLKYAANALYGGGTDTVSHTIILEVWSHLSNYRLLLH